MEDLLADCGLSPIEQRVLLFLLAGGSSSGGMIAKKVKEKRPSVYTALSKLRERGLISVATKNNLNYYQALDKKLLVDALREHSKQAYLKVEGAIDMLVPRMEQLTALKNQSIAGYDIGSTESAVATLSLAEEALTQDYDSIADLESAYSFPGMHDLCVELVQSGRMAQRKQREAVRKGKAADAWIEMLSVSPNYQARTFESAPLVSDLIITRAKVYMFNYEHDEPLCLYIEHPNYVSFMRFVFDRFWAGL